MLILEFRLEWHNFPNILRLGDRTCKVMSYRFSATVMQSKRLGRMMCEKSWLLCIESFLSFVLIKVTKAAATYINPVVIHLWSKMLFLVMVGRGSGRLDIFGILVDGSTLTFNLGLLRDPWTSMHSWKPGLEMIYITSADILLART